MNLTPEQTKALRWVQYWADKWEEMNVLYPDDSDPHKGCEMTFLAARLVETIDHLKQLVER